jgi:hypothetical protein
MPQRLKFGKSGSTNSPALNAFHFRIGNCDSLRQNLTQVSYRLIFNEVFGAVFEGLRDRISAFNNNAEVGACKTLRSVCGAKPTSSKAARGTGSASRDLARNAA